MIKYSLLYLLWEIVPYLFWLFAHLLFLKALHTFPHSRSHVVFGVISSVIAIAAQIKIISYYSQTSFFYYVSITYLLYALSIAPLLLMSIYYLSFFLETKGTLTASPLLPRSKRMLLNFVYRKVLKYRTVSIFFRINNVLKLETQKWYLFAFNFTVLDHLKKRWKSVEKEYSCKLKEAYKRYRHCEESDFFKYIDPIVDEWLRERQIAEQILLLASFPCTSKELKSTRDRLQLEIDNDTQALGELTAHLYDHLSFMPTPQANKFALTLSFAEKKIRMQNAIVKTLESMPPFSKEKIDAMVKLGLKYENRKRLPYSTPRDVKDYVRHQLVQFIDEYINIALTLDFKPEEEMASASHGTTSKSSDAHADYLEKPLGMAWYHFLRYFALFAGAIYNLFSGVRGLTGAHYESNIYGITADQVYAYFGDQLQAIDMLYGIFCIMFALFALVLRHKLAHYEPDVPKLITVFYFLNVIAPLAYAIAFGIITEEMGAALAEVFASTVWGLIYLFANIKYFKRRSHLFVGKESHAQDFSDALRESISPARSRIDYVKNHHTNAEKSFSGRKSEASPSEEIIPTPTSADVPSTRTYEQELVEAANKKERLAAMELRVDLRNYIEMARNELRAYVDEAKEKYDPQRRTGDAKYMAFIKYTFASTAYERTSAAIDEISEKISAIKSPRDVKDTWYSIQIAIDRYALNVDHAYGKETLAQDLFLYFFSSTNEERRQIANEQRANPIYGDETISVVMDLCLRIEKFFDK